MLRSPRRAKYDGAPTTASLKSPGHRHGDHVLVDHLAELNPGVVSVCDDVDGRVAHDEVELHVRVIARESR